MSDNVHDNKLQILGKLAASLTHEIKNPLSVLKLNLEFLNMSREKYDAETIECIDASLEAADIINKLIHNTLEFSRKHKHDYDHYNINDIVKKSIDITRGSSNKKNIAYSLDLNKNLPSLYVSETKILQVFVNIISNAIEASPKNSKISISTSNSKNKIKINIIDEGCGLKNSEAEKVFDEFYTNKHTGTGLGLSVCKKLLDEHQAEYSLTNNKEKGTTFKIEFDLAKSEEE